MHDCLQEHFLATLAFYSCQEMIVSAEVAALELATISAEELARITAFAHLPQIGFAITNCICKRTDKAIDMQLTTSCLC